MFADSKTREPHRTYPRSGLRCPTLKQAVRTSRAKTPFGGCDISICISQHANILAAAAALRLSELEIYEGLDVARLDLHDAPDGEGHKRHLPPERGVDDAVADVDIDLLGQEVHGVAQHYEGEDGLVSLDHLRD